MIRSTRLTRPFTRRARPAAALLATALLAGASAVRASEADAILQALVKKGVLSENEAAKIQDDAGEAGGASRRQQDQAFQLAHRAADLRRCPPALSVR